MSHTKKLRSLFSSAFSSNELSTSPLDPFNPATFPEEIKDHIISYLSVPDMAEASLVSKLWNETIGSSASFKKRVAIKLHAWQREQPNVIRSSSRSYETFTVADYELSMQRLQFLKSKSWKDVTMSFGRVSSQRKFVEFMEMLETVRDLKILCTNISKLDDSKPISLPNMRTCVLSDVTLDLFDMLMTTQPSLKSLAMRFVIQDVGSPKSVGQALLEFLELNSGLKQLELNYTVTNAFFETSLPAQLPLNLRSLTLGLNETREVVRSYIKDFIASQRDSLQHLKLILHQKFVGDQPNHLSWGKRKLNVLPSDDLDIIYSTWNSHVNLQVLEIRFMQDSDEFDENRQLMRTLQKDVNLTSLFVQFINVNAPTSIITNLIRLSPNLQTLYVSRLTSNIVRLAATELRRLKSLNCFSMDAQCLATYTELKTTRDDVNKFITINDRCAYG